MESAKLLLFCNFCNTLSLSPVTKKYFKKLDWLKDIKNKQREGELSVTK